jgi:hypothetical protein
MQCACQLNSYSKSNAKFARFRIGQVKSTMELQLQLVELHFSQPPKLDFSSIKARAEAILGDELDASESPSEDATYLLAHNNYLIQYADGQAPALTAILAAHEPIDLKRYGAEIEQSWRFRDCEEYLRKSRHTLLITEMMARLLAPMDRVRLFHGVLQAAIELTQPEVLVFKHSQQVIRPDAYLAAAADDPILRPGALNVRFYKILDSGGDMLMDTRGLSEIGLHDLQCHFRELNPNDVSNILFNTAIYIFENSAVIESGNTITGIAPDSKWICQFETSLIEPTRDVLDLNPGFPLAAGKRQ